MSDWPTGDTFNHQAPYIAARIEINMPDRRVTTGTGFFYQVRIPFNGGERYALLLISNRHVLYHGHYGNVSIDLTLRKPDRTPDHGRTFTYHINGFAERYIPHPNQTVDLACLYVTDLLHNTDLFFMYLDQRYLAPIDDSRVAPGSEVLFVGYPHDYYDQHNNLPLVRRGTLASLPHIDFDNKGHLIIDAQVFSGSSGSPVFVSWGSTYYLLGVIQGTAEGRTPSGTPAVLGLGTVIKQRHVQELVDTISTRIRATLAADPPPTPTSE